MPGAPGCNFGQTNLASPASRQPGSRRAPEDFGEASTITPVPLANLVAQQRVCTSLRGPAFDMIPPPLCQGFFLSQIGRYKNCDQSGGIDMKHALKAVVVVAACGLLVVGASPAEAKGCLKGAVVGGVGGHMAGHGALGAAGGCAVGHHMANKTERNTNQQQFQREPAPSYNQNRP